MKNFTLSLFLFLCIPTSQAQEVKKEEKSVMKDTLDGELDLSNYIINLHGLKL